MSRARCFLIFFLLLCGIVGGSVFLCRVVIKDMATGLFESLKENGLFPGGMSVDYDKMSFGLSLSPKAEEDRGSEVKGEAKPTFPHVNITLSGFSIGEKEKGLQLEADAVEIAYGITGKHVRIAIPKGFVDITNIDESFGEGYEDLRCSVNPILVIEWRDNLFLATVKKLLSRKGNKGEGNKVVSFNYVDVGGINCKGLSKGEDISVYNDARFKFRVTGDSEVHADAEINTKERPAGKLSLKVSDIVVRFSKSEKMSNVSVAQAELWGDDFSSTLDGSIVLSEKCEHYSLFNICECDFTIGMAGYDNLWNFFEEILQKRHVLDEEGRVMIMSHSMFHGIKKVVRDISTVGGDDKLTLNLKKMRNGNITVGNITFAEFIDAVRGFVSEEQESLASNGDSSFPESMDESLESLEVPGTPDISATVPEDLANLDRELSQ